MSNSEGIQTPESLSEDELRQFSDYCRQTIGDGNIPYMEYFLALSGGWDREREPRVDLTLNWNAPFYKGLYPGLEDEDILSFRTLARIDGEAWIELNALMAECRADDREEEWVEIFAENADSIVNGIQKQSEESSRSEAAGSTSIVIGRIEQGMSRQLRMLSAMIVLHSAVAGKSSESLDSLNTVQDVLRLSEAELNTIREILLFANR